jgi:hypothetical protein
MKIQTLRALTALGLALAGIGSAAAATSWTLTGGGAETGALAAGNTRSYNGSGNALTVSAWSNTKNSTTAANAYIENAYLASYSGGLGVTNRDGVSGGGDTNEGTIAQTSVPGHTMDNELRYDSMLFDFGVGKSFQLKSVTVGWWQTDSDLTVLAYTGTGTPTFTGSSASQSYASLLGSGWSVVKSSAGTTGTAHYANAANGGVAQSSNAAGYQPLAVNDLNISARYWLIGALNTLVQALPSGATVGVGNDYVKIAGVGGDFRGVPEPAGFMLLGVTLAGLVVYRRRTA